MRSFCVFGNPISHSRSPDIHALFAKQYGHEISYKKQLVSLHGFARTIATEFNQGLAGANVTVPFKQQAWQQATKLTEEARASGAVNTLIPLPAGGLLGANTDGAGLLRDIRRQGIDLAGRRVLILGAGGATRGVLKNILDAKPETVWIANRTTSKAQQLGDGHANVQAVTTWQTVSGVDIVINATSASLSGKLPDVPTTVLGGAQFVYDMVYGSGRTSFLAHTAAVSEAQLSDGLGMLVGQAAESYRLWWQCELPQIAAVIEHLRHSMD